MGNDSSVTLGYIYIVETWATLIISCNESLHSFIQQYLLSAYYVSGTVLDPREIAVNKQPKILLFMESIEEYTKIYVRGWQGLWRKIKQGQDKCQKQWSQEDHYFIQSSQRSAL